jgi:hypothetical protein
MKPKGNSSIAQPSSELLAKLARERASAREAPTGSGHGQRRLRPLASNPEAFAAMQRASRNDFHRRPRAGGGCSLIERDGLHPHRVREVPR